MNIRPLLASLLVTAAASASAQQLVVDFFADGETRFTDYFSNSYAQVDLTPNGMYDLGTNQLNGSGVQVFPLGDAWLDIGLLTLDGTPTEEGVENFTITGATFDFAKAVDLRQALVLSSSYSTIVTNITAGTVTLTDGEVTTMNFSAGIGFAFDADPSRIYNGTLTITADAFTVAMDDTETFGGLPIRLAADATGVPGFVPVPEPGALGLLGLTAVTGLLVRARRRRTTRA